LQRGRGAERFLYALNTAECVLTCQLQCAAVKPVTVAGRCPFTWVHERTSIQRVSERTVEPSFASLLRPRSSNRHETTTRRELCTYTLSKFYNSWCSSVLMGDSDTKGASAPRRRATFTVGKSASLLPVNGKSAAACESTGTAGGSVNHGRGKRDRSLETGRTKSKSETHKRMSDTSDRIR